ncbi:hypothetical protein F1544_04920 [Kineosporiaceae bacterium B12]|nr:hypothetical protein [Kineococcus rubinsiae]
MPGESAALVGGAAASLGQAPLPLVLAVVATAAVLADSVGYLMGLPLRHPAPGVARAAQARAADVARARALVDARGGAAVFLRRFTAFLRAVTSALAGAVGMPYRRFAVWNVLGGLTWSTWPGLAWAGLGWPGLAWAGLGWPGLAWAGLGWPGLAWAGLGWPGLGWVSGRAGPRWGRPEETHSRG